MAWATPPKQVVVAISLRCDDLLRAPAIGARVVRIEERIRASHAEVMAVFVKLWASGARPIQSEPHHGDSR